jgi:hypothetical protein
MSLAGSIGTSRGMRLHYMRKPKCKHCPKVNSKGKPVKPKVLFKHGAFEAGMCSGCFKKLTGEKFSEQFTLFLKEEKERIKKFLNGNQGQRNDTYGLYIKWLRAKIRAKQEEINKV